MTCFFFFRGGEGGKERGPFWRHISSRRRRDWARSTSFVVCRYLFMYEIFETVKLVEICSLETYTFPFNLRLNSHWQSSCTDTNKFTTYFSIYWISNDIRTFGWGKLPHNSQISNAKKENQRKIAGLPIWIAFSYEVTPFTFRECKGCREILMKSDIVKKFFWDVLNPVITWNFKILLKKCCRE